MTRRYQLDHLGFDGQVSSLKLATMDPNNSNHTSPAILKYYTIPDIFHCFDITNKGNNRASDVVQID